MKPLLCFRAVTLLTCWLDVNLVAQLGLWLWGCLDLALHQATLLPTSALKTQCALHAQRADHTDLFSLPALEHIKLLLLKLFLAVIGVVILQASLIGY